MLYSNCQSSEELICEEFFTEMTRAEIDTYCEENYDIESCIDSEFWPEFLAMCEDRDTTEEKVYEFFKNTFRKEEV